jgi:hypothetical protein
MVEQIQTPQASKSMGIKKNLAYTRFLPTNQLNKLSQSQTDFTIIMLSQSFVLA